MTTTGEGGGEKCIRHGDGGGFISKLCAEAKDVGVIMFAGDGGLLDRTYIGSANVAMAVGSNGHADSRGARENTEVVGAISDGAGD